MEILHERGLGDPAVNYARVVEILDLTGAMGIGAVGLVTARIGN